MIIRKTKPEEGQRVNELFAIAFELPAETGPSSSEDNGTVCWAALQTTTRP